MPRAFGLRTVLPAEQAVVLMLAGDENDDELAAALRGAIDWHALLALASIERAAAELARRVRHLTAVDVPDSVRAALQRIAMVSEFEMAHLEHCLHGALSAIDALETRVMLLKGAALVHSVYGGDFARRPMADIDVMVDAARADDVQQALLAGQWQETVPPDRTNAYRDHHHLPPLRDARGSRVHLEIHTALFRRGHPFRLTPDLLWAAAEPLGAPLPIARGAVVPAVLHQLLHVCLHFAWSHAMRFGAWRAFRDVRAIVASNRVDWDAFVRLARDTRSATSSYWTFRLAHTVAGVRVPPDVIRALQPPRPHGYLRWLERHYVLNLIPAIGACPSVQLGRTLWNLGMLPAQSGHGDVRPWDRDTLFTAAVSGPTARGPGGRAVQLWRVARYLSIVVGVAPAGPHGTAAIARASGAVAPGLADSAPYTRNSRS